MRKSLMLKLFAPLAAALLAGCAVAPPGPVGADKVVYHVNDASAQAVAALRNIGNHLEVNPKAKIVVVTHAQGVDFLFNDAKDKDGNPFQLMVERLKGQGVDFNVCEITLRNRKLTRDKFISEVNYTPSGVAEITRLQQREGYAYLRP